MNVAHVGVHGSGLPDSLLSGTLPSYGASVVARTSDRGRVTEVMFRLFIANANGTFFGMSES